MRRNGHEKGAGTARPWLPAVTVGAAVCVAVLAVLCYLSMQDIQRGLLATVARQQDEYVDLVVGQINLHNEPDDEGVINDILGVIDDSSGQYWTFSKDGSLLFVRDAAETDKYRGMPDATYFDEDGARDFYDGLSADEASHTYLTLDGRDYIASGRAFDYDGSTYRLCLLTNQSAVLDDNQILGARSRLAALVGIESALLLFATIWLAARRDRAARKLAQARGEVSALTNTVERLNRRIARDRLYRLEDGLWSADALGDFEESLARRSASAWLAELVFASEEDQRAFVERADVLLGADVPRFAGAGSEGEGGAGKVPGGPGSLTMRVLFVRQDEDAAKRLLSEVMAGLAAQVLWSRVGAADAASGPRQGARGERASQGQATEATKASQAKEGKGE